jgi:ubiquinone/menaquinone biosynthesis C-methylase UbiE
MSDVVASHWGDVAIQRSTTQPISGWLDSPLVQQLYVGPLTGSQDGNWLACQIERLNIPCNGRWLSVGCGGGGLELFAAQQGLCAHIEGVDIAPAAIEFANATAAERGITNALFRTANLEHCRLDANAYDVILCAMGLHHIRRLEFFFEEAARALKPGGWILLNEYVGPNQWQWSDAQLTAMNLLLDALPERYRVHAITGEIKRREERPSIEWMNQADPSESIRAADILPLLHQQFQIVEQHDYGGAVLHKVLEYIVANFDADRAEDIALLRLLFACEQALIQTGALTSDFSLVAARNRKQSLRHSYLSFDSQFERAMVYGFYAPERTPTGQTFCWTMPEAEVVLDCPPGAQALRIVLGLPPVPRIVTIAVDDILVGALKSNARGDIGPFNAITLRLPQAFASQPPIRIQIDQPWSPMDLWGENDRRTLGVALLELSYI